MPIISIGWQTSTDLIQVVKPFIWVVTVISALAIAEASDPGRELYLTAGGYGCGVCHGPVANGGGQAGGSIRGASRAAFDKALAEQPTMRLLVNALSQNDIAELSRYLVSLDKIPLVELEYSDLGWRITQQPIAKGQVVQLVVSNHSFADLVLNLQSFGFAATTITPLDTRVLEWKAEAGTFFLPDNELLVVSTNEVCEH